MISDHQLHRLFYPESIAMVGASPKGNFGFGGNGPILGSIRQNFQGNIYPVHPKAETILGYKAYASVLDIPGDVDLAIFSVPLTVVEQVMKDCAAKKVKFVHLYTSGFSETGRSEHARIEDRIIQIAKENNIRVVGPNCMGIYCPDGGLAWGEMFQTRPGSIGVFSQSGQLANSFISNGESYGLSFSKVISFGNASDLQAQDFLSYLSEDPKTDIIGAYLEGLDQGRAFYDLAQKTTPRKPMVIFKGGMTDGGARASKSHTSSLAGSPEIWKGLCRQTGIIPVFSKEELITTLSALKHLPLPKGNRVALFGGAGGGSVTMTDLMETHGLRVPQLSEKAIEDMESTMPIEGHSVKNPIDMVPALFDRDMFMKILSILDAEEEIDAVFYYIFSPGPVTGRLANSGHRGLDMLSRIIIEGVKSIRKPFYFVVERDENRQRDGVMGELRTRIQEAGIPAFPSLDLAARAAMNMCRYQEFLSAEK
ncbi:MAG: acetate--CoA ligase family protein [Proteobacteria bacterium]|nr:acetate--CoA ligase family protein [Pseudomonadota bacterium]MBU4471088.1 acetate--CoA ligase family protein [Pseudomonadota bacterium]MCG2750211.1 acetate--CoA ligase family protein [Desulfobacteraceae bacterium]